MAKQSACLIATSEVGDDPRLLELTWAATATATATAKGTYNGAGMIRAAERGYPRIVAWLLDAGVASPGCCRQPAAAAESGAGAARVVTAHRPAPRAPASRPSTPPPPGEKVSMSDTPVPPGNAIPTANDPAGTLSRRQALAAGGGLVATLAAGTVAAAGPAAATTTDSQDAELGDASAAPQAQLSISLPQAKAVLRAAEREARRLQVPSFIVVVDVCGDLKAASRQDGNSRASITLAPLKAAPALAFQTSTSTLAARTTDPVRAQSLLAAGFTLLGGGLPLATKEGVVIGAIGTGGGSPEQDEQIAQVGLTALAQ